MVKLASARESRAYGPRLARNRAEYTNAGLYLFGTIVLVSGFVAQLSNEPRSGLALLLIALGFLVIVNVHDLVAHLAGVDFHFSLVWFDAQLALVEFAVPVVQTIGTLLYFLGILFLFIQAEKGYGYFKLEKHALNLLIAGPVLWLLGSIHNSCQIYERADDHAQILQQSVLIPFLMGSLLFLVGAILNSQEQSGPVRHHGLDLLGWNWVWLGIAGSFLLFIGGLANVMKVFKFQQDGGMRLEKLRGGAQERLAHEREGQVPFILEEQRRRRKESEENQVLLSIREEERRRRTKEAEESIIVEQRVEAPAVVPTPYKDVLLGGDNNRASSTLI